MFLADCYFKHFMAVGQAEVTDGGSKMDRFR